MSDRFWRSRWPGRAWVAASIASPIILPVFQLPQPTGPYGIGTVTYDWTDASRPELFSTNSNARRELMVQIWYPAQENPSSALAPYIPTANAVMAVTAQIHSWPNFALQSVNYVTSHAMKSVLVTNDRPSYPVLIYLEGLTGYRELTTFQDEELVSTAT